MGNNKSNKFDELEEWLNKEEGDYKYINSDKEKDQYFDYSIYNKKGKLIYRGGYKNNKLNGWGEMYNSNGELRYAGNFIDGYPDGFGLLYLKNVKYEGNFKNGKLEGKGKAYYNDLKNGIDCVFSNGELIK